MILEKLQIVKLQVITPTTDYTYTVGSNAQEITELDSCSGYKVKLDEGIYIKLTGFSFKATYVKVKQ